jgi:hypothetical protein
MRVLRNLALSTCLAVSSLYSATVSSNDKIIPLVRDGGGWTTAIKIVNLDDRPAFYEIHFRKRRGLSDIWNLKLSGPNIEVRDGIAAGILQPRGHAVIETPGTSEQMTQGYVEVVVGEDSKVGAYGLLQKKDEPSLVIPLAPELEERFSLPFDLRDGASTTLVVVSETPFPAVDFVVRDQAGVKVFEERVEIGASDPGAQELIDLGERFPELKGTRGVLEATTTFPQAGIYDRIQMSAIALQRDTPGTVMVVETMSPPVPARLN